MRNNFILLLTFCITCLLYAEIIDKVDGDGTFDAYKIYPKEYTIIDDSFIIDSNTGDLNEDIVLPKGSVIKPTFYGSIWIKQRQHNPDDTTFKDHLTKDNQKGRVIVIDNNSPSEGYISIDDVYISNSDILPNSITTKMNSPVEFYWVPSYTIDIIKSKDRNEIFTFEPNRPKVGYDAYPLDWYEGDPSALFFFIANTQLEFYFLSAQTYGLIYNIQKQNNFLYAITFSILKEEFQREKINKKLQGFSYIENMPNLDSSKQAILLLEINKNRMRVYNGETKRIIFDLIKISTEFYDKYIEFIETNQIPTDLIIPDELKKGWPGDIKIASPYSDEKSLYQVTTNLRMRKSPNTNGEIIQSLAEGTVIQALEPGLSETIDGITAPWVWMRTEDGTEGWCFAGYLKAYKEESTAPAVSVPINIENNSQDTESKMVEASQNSNTGTSSVPVIPLAVGGGIIVIGLGIFLFIKMKKK